MSNTIITFLVIGVISLSACTTTPVVVQQPLPAFVAPPSSPAVDLEEVEFSKNGNNFCLTSSDTFALLENWNKTATRMEQLEVELKVYKQYVDFIQKPIDKSENGQ